MPDKKTNLEQQMIRHCAPVLAGMKVANLFRYQAETEECLKKEMEDVSQKLKWMPNWQPLGERLLRRSLSSFG